MLEKSNQESCEAPPSTWSDYRIDQVIGNLLRIGVTVSAVVVFVGGVLFLADDGRQPNPALRSFQAEPEALRTPLAILQGTAAGNSRAIIMLGLLLLIATPVTRVLFSVLAFALQGDYLYVVVTLFVLAVLVYSLLSGYLSDSGML